MPHCAMLQPSDCDGQPSPIAMSYCSFLLEHPEESLHKAYHDSEYGFPLEADPALFERLVLEINQAGLNWGLILRRAAQFHKAYDGFDIDKVAAYGEADTARLLADAGVIRNRLKVNAAIENARRIQSLRPEFGSFKGWLDAHHPLPLEAWVKLFKKTFVFTGGEIVNEFLVSTGYLPGAHDPECPVYWQIARLLPPWTRGLAKVVLTRHPDE
jgi:DNA-3-methyladenine glycosylase I